MELCVTVYGWCLVLLFMAGALCYCLWLVLCVVAYGWNVVMWLMA